ncbi:MAG: hypothetical protein AAGL98_11815, partial [Planctomycetota bacterium]
MRFSTTAPVAGLGLILAGPASAQVVVDGALDPDYGAALSVQRVGTQFGNNTDSTPELANGSELDAAYGIVADGNLNLFFAGNLQTSFNKLEIFIDAIDGGQNTILNNNPDVDFDAINRMGFNDDELLGPVGPGLTFDTNFTADHYITVTGGNDPVEYFANFATLPTAGEGVGEFLGTGGAGVTTIAGGNGINLGFDQSNVLGVGELGLPDDSDPATVATGVEVSIPLSVIGSPVGDIKVSAFINGLSHDFLSNQILGSLEAGTGELGADPGNLGEPRNVDFATLAGDQFFTVVNEAAGFIDGDYDGNGFVSQS